MSKIKRKKLCKVYREGVLTVCQWFSKFRSDNFNVKDEPRSGRPVEANEDKVKANRRLTTREIAARLNLSNSVHEITFRITQYIIYLSLSIYNVQVN